VEFFVAVAIVVVFVICLKVFFDGGAEAKDPKRSASLWDTAQWASVADSELDGLLKGWTGRTVSVTRPQWHEPATLVGRQICDRLERCGIEVTRLSGDVEVWLIGDGRQRAGFVPEIRYTVRTPERLATTLRPQIQYEGLATMTAAPKAVLVEIHRVFRDVESQATAESS
jgi:hypothetical protein